MMRHGSRPFVVEVKRGQKRTALVHTAEPAPLPSPPPENTSLDDIFRRAEAALFERAAAPAVQSLSSSDAPAAPQRRILENLTEVDPLAVLLAERGEASRRGRKPGSKNKPKDVVAEDIERTATIKKNSNVELTPERINEALKAMERVTGAYSGRRPKSMPAGAPRQARAAPQPFVPAPSVAAPTAAGSELDGRVAPTHGAGDNVHLPVPPRERAADIAGETSRPRERASIRNRYVTGTEPRPGERWKRRLRGVL